MRSHEQRTPGGIAAAAGAFLAGCLLAVALAAGAAAGGGTAARPGPVPTAAGASQQPSTVSRLDLEVHERDYCQCSR